MKTLNEFATEYGKSPGQTVADFLTLHGGSVKETAKAMGFTTKAVNDWKKKYKLKITFELPQQTKNSHVEGD